MVTYLVLPSFIHSSSIWSACEEDFMLLLSSENFFYYFFFFIVSSILIPQSPVL